MNNLSRRQQHFDGATYQPRLDYERLSNQLERVKAATLDTGWWTVPALTLAVGGPSVPFGREDGTSRVNRWMRHCSRSASTNLLFWTSRCR